MPRILLVDDDIAEISAVKRALARAGHQPALATNASDALVALTHERPDLLVVSSTCENGDALGLARGLPDDPETAGIPVLVLGDTGALPQGARLLGRPVDPEQLLAEVEAALGAAVDPPAAAPRPSAPIARVQPSKVAVPAAASAPRASPSGLQDAAAARRAAADALRARAEELRKSGPRAPAAAAAPAPAAAPAIALAPPARPAPSPPARRASLAAPVLVPPPPPEPPPPQPAPAWRPPPAPDPAPARTSPPPPVLLDLEDGELESELRRAGVGSSGEAGGSAAAAEAAAQMAEDARSQAADEALRALEEEAAAHAGGAGRVSEPAWWTEEDDKLELARAQEVRAAEEHALQEAIETARREAFEAAKRELEERARQQAAEAHRHAEAEARARQEAVAAAQRASRELALREADEARRRSEAEERVRSEAEARRRAEQELASVRAQLEEERRRSEQQLTAVQQRAAAEEQASAELRRMAEDEVRRHDQVAQERGEEEERLRSAIASARAEMEALRERNVDEARRRGEAEEALRKLADAAKREGEARLFAEAAPQAPDGRAAAPAAYTPPPFFAPFDDAEAAGTPAHAEETARRRVAALRAAPAQPLAEPASTGTLDPAAELAAEAPSPSGEAPPEPAEEPARLLTPPPAQLRGGSLAELPAPRLLAQAGRSKVTGRYDFQGEAPRSIWLEDGRVVGASSADPSERLEEVALRLGLVTRDQHRQIAQAAASLPTRRAALLLLERGFLKPSELTGLVRRRTEEVVFGVFADPEATFRWVGAEVPPEERIALPRGTLALAVEGVRRRWLGPRVDALLGGAATLLTPVAGGPTAAELGLSPEERRAVSLADGLRTLDELSQASPLDPLSTRQVLAALVLCGALSVRLLQAGRPSGQAAAAIDLARLKDKLDQVRRADYFTVLGVSRLCTPHEVRDAAERLRAEFEPRRFAGIPDESLASRLAEILQVIGDAREVLADDRLRDEYLRGLG